MTATPRRQPAGTRAGGEFAQHDRSEASVALHRDRPMPALDDTVEYNGQSWRVVLVQDRTATLINDAGDLTLASGCDLRLDGPAAPEPLTETLRRRRGHRFYPSFKGWPKIGAHADTPLAEIPLRAHYFSPNADWWIAEVDPDTGRAWGFARFANMPESAEWGSVDLTELEALHPSPFYIVERDLDFERTAAGTALAEYARQAL